MFDLILKALTGNSLVTTTKIRDLRVAIAALLVHAAQADDQFEEIERSMIKQLLAGRFGLDPAQTTELLDTAERGAENATGLFRFVQCIVEQLSPDDRVELIEMLWDVAYADDFLSPSEDALIRRIAGLIYVTDRERGEARKRVLDRRTSVKNDPDRIS